MLAVVTVAGAGRAGVVRSRRDPARGPKRIQPDTQWTADRGWSDSCEDPRSAGSKVDQCVAAAGGVDLLVDPECDLEPDPSIEQPTGTRQGSAYAIVGLDAENGKDNVDVSETCEVLVCPRLNDGETAPTVRIRRLFDPNAVNWTADQRPDRGDVSTSFGTATGRAPP